MAIACAVAVAVEAAPRTRGIDFGSHSVSLAGEKPGYELAVLSSIVSPRLFHPENPLSLTTLVL